MPRVIHNVRYNNCDIYTVAFEGPPIAVTVTVTTSPTVIKKWLFTTLYISRRFVYRRSLIVGLGVQWTPGTADSPADTLQLCVGQRCLIFQLDCASLVPLKLRRFLLDPSHAFVGFWNNFDRQKLLNSRHCLEMAMNPLDLRWFAEGEHGEILQEASVNEIVVQCLGLAVDQRREISMSDWDREELRGDQIVYATVDAYCAFRLGKKIDAWQFNR